MNTLRIAIIDDAQQERELLTHYLNDYFTQNPVYKQIEVYWGGEQFLSHWQAGIYDIIFIDIFLGDMSGITIAETIRKTDCECLLIFTTNSTDYAVKGFELRATDYLVKPLSYVKVKSAMDYCKKSLVKHNRFIEVKESRTMVKIRLDDIVFTDYFNHYIQIHTKKKIIRSYMKFEEFSPLLLYYPQFLFCYRNCIVNMDKIVSLEKNDFIMDTDERVPITRRIRQEIHQKYADYQFQKINGSL